MGQASYSSINLHRKCPQAWAYKYVERVEEADDSPRPPLIFGSWWHALLAADGIQRGKAMGTLRSVPESITTVDGGPELEQDASPQDVLDEALLWWLDLDDLVQEDIGKFIGQDLPARLEGLYRRWKRRWRAERRREAPLGIEVRWNRSLDGETSLQGTVDEVYKDLNRQIVVIRDHKTAKTLGATSNVDDLMDSQLHLYAYGVNEVVKSWDQGPIRAVGYDRVRTLAPKTPKLNKDGSLSKSVTDYDLEAYLTWARGTNGQGVYFEGRTKDGSGAGYYRPEKEVIERLRGEQLSETHFQRTLTPLSKPVIRTHLLAARGTAVDMAETRTDYEEHGQAQRNISAGNCKWCEFSDLCRAQMFGAEVNDEDLPTYGLKRK